MLCVDEVAQITGTIGGGCVEAEVRRRAHELLSIGGMAKPAEGGRRHDVDEKTGTADPTTLGVPSGVLVTMDLDNDFGFDDGLICGGHMEVAACEYSNRDQTRPLQEALDQLRAGHPATVPIRVQKPGGLVEYRINLESAPKVVIAGGGHVGRALAPLMVPLGFRVSIIDDRTDFANAERFPPPMEPVVGDINKTLEDWAIDANTYVVIVTRGHKHDERALLAVIDSPAKYIGMIGSKRKIAVIFEDLMHEGVPKEKLDRVHAPIGIAIRCITPEEIALSIAAELVSVRRERYRRMVEGPLEVGRDS
jgi:xanthine/CO dehydrogenase XdhC/CoxF family maturation factor